MDQCVSLLSSDLSLSLSRSHIYTSYDSYDG